MGERRFTAMYAAVRHGVRMRILFFLPVITPWWFDHIVTPMLRGLHDDAGVAEIHLMVAPLWRNTGVMGDQLAPIADLAKLRWHIIDEADPEMFRRSAQMIPGLLDSVAAIAPDLTLARSADFDTPARFPGVVRYIMEGAAAPFVTDPAWVVLEELPFEYGGLPDDTALIDGCVDRMAPLWDHARAAAATREACRAALGLPGDRAVLAVPLQYEHAENFYLGHAAYPGGIALLTALLDRVPADVLIAVSDHPLNRLHVNRTALDFFAASHGDRIRLITAEDATARLTLAADAVLTDLSKTWSLAAFAGTPLLHVGAYPLADWLAVNADVRAIGRGGMLAPDADAARRWFAWHLAGRLLRPDAVDLPSLLRHVAQHATHDDLDANVAALTSLIGEPA